MSLFYTADYINPITSSPIKNGIIEIGDDNVIKNVYSPDQFSTKKAKVKKMAGVLIPGFVNAHCHLELSHMLGAIPRKTGLPDFLTQVMSDRNHSEKKIVDAMKIADKKMFENGIQAVGDHANTAISSEVKRNSKITYHTFVEVLGMDVNTADNKIDAAKEIEFHFDHKHTSITLHAPYSCSRKLFKQLGKSVLGDNILSIHNQESDEENRLFRYGTGEFINFYKKNKIPYNDFSPTGRDSLQSIVRLLPKNNPLLLVHNTFTNLKDIHFLQRVGLSPSFVLCPKANLYIEGTLPDLSLFEHYQHHVAVGTDSLASNNSLDILDELRTLKNGRPELSWDLLLKWATINGAIALGLSDTIGSLEVGKKPGLILLENTNELRITNQTKVLRIV